ncbi:DUF6095 family protein [Flavobacterium cerinum]|uniref:Uncharacterized protein n=1 Tax=Flavobacterium cerinum TaxID=2502784 RepID=A0A3S3QDA6_9FLAO|nr:DUF6095 family protein [Flavobacterium cerinum]RWX00487.1 hypothetical protein EPI11_09435 [Flavobacterium cerinum]
MATDKKILAKGIRYLSGALPLFFIGPVVIHSSFKNEKHFLFIPVLGIGIVLCILAMLLMFKGLKTIMNSLFDKEK